MEMVKVKAAMDEQMKLIEDLLHNFSAQLRSGLTPAYHVFMGFFRPINWKEPWLMGLMGFHVVFLLTTIISRRHVNFQMFLFLLALSGVYLAEILNRFLGSHWKSFATKNYFDPHGVFLSVLWSGPLLVISMLILVNMLFTLCYTIVRWKRAELRHRASRSQKKET